MSPGRFFSSITLILALCGSALFFCGPAGAQGNPMLTFSTYLGGSNNDMGEGSAFDDEGNIYVAGYTSSADFPGGPPPFTGTYDGFVTKFSPTGDVVDTVFLGGAGQDYCLGIAVRGDYVFVTGVTDSDDFPDNVAKAGDSDAFVAKLEKGNLHNIIWCKRLGGRGDDEGCAIAVNQDDGMEYVYVAGSTTVFWNPELGENGGYDADFPAASTAFQQNHGGGYWDGFVSKIDSSDGIPVYSTYLGSSGDDEAYGIYAAPDGVVYVTGWTGGVDFPQLNAYQSTMNPYDRHAFLTIFDTSPGNTLLYSTYLGGSEWDYGMAITVDGAGIVYVAGMTRSPDFPIFPLGNSLYGGDAFDGFVAKFNPYRSGYNSLVASTYIGGSGSDRCMGVKVAPGASGYEVYLVGDTSSPNFLGRSLRIRRGYPEVFLVKLSENWSLSDPASYVAFLTGGDIDYGRALDVRRFYSDGKTITDICLTGGTLSNNFTTANPSYYFSGSFDAFVAKFTEGAEEPEPPSPPKPPKPPKNR